MIRAFVYFFEWGLPAVVVIMLVVVLPKILSSGHPFGVTVVQKDEWFDCIDLRDGEGFRFNTDSVKDWRARITGGSSLTLTDTTGKEWHWDSDTAELIFKCEEI